MNLLGRLARLARLAPLLGVACGAGACGSSGAEPVEEGLPSSTSPAPAPAEEDPESATREDEIGASCINPSRYFVALAENERCEAVPGARGKWLPGRAFADAPSEVSASTCALRWRGDKLSEPDRGALDRRFGARAGIAASCGASTTPDIGAVQAIPALDVYGHAGSVGCDVCGKLRNGRIWVVLPAERIGPRQFAVKLTNGQDRAFQIAPSRNAALSIALPPPPPGTQYRDGTVFIY